MKNARAYNTHVDLDYNTTAIYKLLIGKFLVKRPFTDDRH